MKKAREDGGGRLGLQQGSEPEEDAIMSADNDKDEPAVETDRTGNGEDETHPEWQPDAKHAPAQEKEDIPFSTSGSPKPFTILQRGSKHGVDYALVRLESGGVPVSGTGWVSALRGGIEVFGAILEAGDERPALVSSAPYTSYILSLRPHGVAAVDARKRGSRAGRVHPEARVHMLVRRELISAGGEWTEAACVGLVTSTGDEGLYEMGETDGLGHETDVFRDAGVFPGIGRLPARLGGTELTRTMGVAEAVGRHQGFEEWCRWDELCAELEGATGEVRVLVHGAGGTGKSTLGRCVANRLLRGGEAVVVVDTDVGQPELGVAGVVSAHVVREWRVGARESAVRGAGMICGRYLGETTAREEPRVYARHVREVVRAARQVAKREGWAVVVNSDGWVSGVGAGLLRELAEECEAGFVVECRVQGGRRGGSGGGGGRVAAAVGGGKRFVMERRGGGGMDGVRGSAYREAVCAAYFAKEVRMGRVYRVEGVSVVAVGEGGCPVGAAAAAAAVRAGLVAVGRRAAGGEVEVEGMGMVRGVERGGAVVYVCSAAGWERLRRCDTLVLSGAVQLPRRVFAQMAGHGIGNGNGTRVPYLMPGRAPEAAPMASRGTLARRPHVPAQQGA